MYDIETKSWVDAPEEVVTKEVEREEEEAKKEEVVEAKKEETKTAEEVAAAVATEEKKPDTAKEPVTDPKKDELPAWLKEKYGIESQEDLQEVLESNSKLADELEKERNKKVFASEKEEKLHKFLLNWDIDMVSEGMQTAAVLIRLDIENIDGKRALEEQFIFENSELTRDEAKSLFNRDYRKKYEVKKENFDDVAEYEEEKKIIEIQLKKEYNRAKKFLLEKQADLKSKPAEEKKPVKEEVSEEVVKTYDSQIKTFFKNNGKEWDRFAYKDEDGTELYNIVLDADKKSQVRQAMEAYVKRTDVYDKNGKIPNFDPASLALKFTQVLFGDWMDKEHHKQIKILAQQTKAEQLAGKKPDKVSKAQGQADGLSIDEQFRELAKREKEKRTK